MDKLTPDEMMLVELSGHEEILLDIDSDLARLDKEIEARCKDLYQRKRELEASRRKIIEMNAVREAQLLEAMEALEMTRWENDAALITVRKGVQSCIIDSEQAVPEAFKEREIVEKIDKVRLKAHLVAHPDDDVGAHLERGKSKLVIKWKEQT